ncbi:hypothetical protein JX265_010770 [Neoarthrinium moseri]|uniref:Uncharacterized protein n=1 Tax=Neoarthrinium moseri TaxID=1658444 RepID=A0A9Q0AKF6_9PEZI|nr:hypothetical protein JX265_010770 [Neoarthrinium moseri]
MHALSIWIETGWKIRKFRLTFANSSRFIAQFVYPADLFVQLQSYADRLGLDWDMDERELCVLWMKERLLPEVGAEEGDEEPDEWQLVAGQQELDELCRDDLKCTLWSMAAREWNDVLFVRDVTPEKLSTEKTMWDAMAGISSMALRE